MGFRPWKVEFYKGLLEQLGYEAKFYRGDAKRQLHREIEILRGVHGLHPTSFVTYGYILTQCGVGVRQDPATAGQAFLGLMPCDTWARGLVFSGSTVDPRATATGVARAGYGWARRHPYGGLYPLFWLAYGSIGGISWSVLADDVAQPVLASFPPPAVRVIRPIDFWGAIGERHNYVPGL